MEESILLLQKFILQIIQSEAKLDFIRSQIHSIPGAKAQLFHSIANAQKSFITPVQICQLSQQLKQCPVAPSVIQRYFRFQQGMLSLDQFCKVLLPHNENNIDADEKESAEGLFMELVEGVISSYEKIQKIRVEMCERKKLIQKYFTRNYGVFGTFDKKVLREFMHEHELYEKCSFINVCIYIFGQITDQIPFSELLSNPNENQELQPSSVVHKLDLKSHEKNQEQRKPFDINDVLEQINNIEKTLKEKKSRNSGVLDINPSKLQESQKIVRKNAGKILNKKRQSQFNDSVKDVREDLRDILIERKRQYIQPSTVTENFYPYFSKYDRHFVSRIPSPYDDRSHRSMRQSSSEAELKIQQIERRAMQKFNTRRHVHEPLNMYEGYQMRSRQNSFGVSHSPFTSRISPRPRYEMLNKLNYQLSSYDHHIRPRYARY